MLRIAEFLTPSPSADWTLARQCGVDRAVGGLPFEMLRAGERVCDLAPLTRMKERYEEGGFSLEVIEARPPLNLTKRGLPGRDEEIDVVCELLTNMGKLGIPVWCYEWMCDFKVVRTSRTTPSRGGSLVTSFDIDHVPDEITAGTPIGEDDLWANLGYFLRRVLPVAERAGVKLSMHPDDPPVPSIKRISRIMRTVPNFRRLVDMLPSACNTITLCQGNFTLMTDDLPAVIRGFVDKISFVHFRDVRGVPDHFVEAWHDAGKTDMLACMKAYRDIEFDGVLRSDHVPLVEGDRAEADRPSALGRLHAIGYIRGLHQAVYSK
jgi:mannonate dehydratase